MQLWMPAGGVVCMQRHQRAMHFRQRTWFLASAPTRTACNALLSSRVSICVTAAPTATSLTVLDIRMVWTLVRMLSSVDAKCLLELVAVTACACKVSQLSEFTSSCPQSDLPAGGLAETVGSQIARPGLGT